MSAAQPVTLVTGAAGFAGSHLIDRLGPAGSVHGWALGDIPAAPTHVTWHTVDLADRAAVLESVRAIAPDRIFHLAGAPNVETSWTNAVPHLSTNAMGTAHLLSAVRAHAPACRVLVVTSAQVYQTGDAPVDEASPLVPSTPYGLTKLAQDELASASARHDRLDVVIARPFNHIGPRQTPAFAIPSFARQIARIERGLEAPVIRVGNLDTYRDFTDVRDVVDAYWRLMEHGATGEAYNICSGSSARLRDLLDTLIGLADIRIGVEIDPARLRPADVTRISGNNAKLSRVTGWAPRRKIDETLRDTLDWWRDETDRTT